MRKSIIEEQISVPIGYSLALMAAYGILLSELINALNRIIIHESLGQLYDLFMRFGFIIYILSVVSVWVATTLIIHLSALLLDGKCSLQRFFRVSAFPNIVNIISIIVGLYLCSRIPHNIDNLSELASTRNVLIIKAILNWSTIPYLLAYCVQVKVLYKLSWIKAFLSVAIPFGAILCLSELFRFV